MRTDGTPFTYLEDSRVHEVTRFYQTALWGYYLKGVAEYRADLLAEPFASDVTVRRSDMP
jgi:hypothetical protein